MYLPIMQMNRQSFRGYCVVKFSRPFLCPSGKCAYSDVAIQERCHIIRVQYVNVVGNIKVTVMCLFEVVCFKETETVFQKGSILQKVSLQNEDSHNPRRFCLQNPF